MGINATFNNPNDLQQKITDIIIRNTLREINCLMTPIMLGQDTALKDKIK